MDVVGSEGVAGARSFMRAESLIVYYQDNMYTYERCVDFLEYLVSEVPNDVSQCREEISCIIEEFLTYFDSKEGSVNVNQESLLWLVVNWLVFCSRLGFDIQVLLSKAQNCKGGTRKRFVGILTSLQAEQVRDWCPFDTNKKGGSLAEIKRLVEET